MVILSGKRLKSCDKIICLNMYVHDSKKNICSRTCTLTFSWLYVPSTADDIRISADRTFMTSQFGSRAVLQISVKDGVEYWKMLIYCIILTYFLANLPVSH